MPDRFFVYCRFWPGFGGDFPFGQFNALPDEKTMPHLQAMVGEKSKGKIQVANADELRNLLRLIGWSGDYIPDFAFPKFVIAQTHEGEQAEVLVNTLNAAYVNNPGGPHFDFLPADGEPVHARLLWEEQLSAISSAASAPPARPAPAAPPKPWEKPWEANERYSKQEALRKLFAENDAKVHGERQVALWNKGQVAQSPPTINPPPRVIDYARRAKLFLEAGMLRTALKMGRGQKPRVGESPAAGHAERRATGLPALEADAKRFLQALDLPTWQPGIFDTQEGSQALSDLFAWGRQHGVDIPTDWPSQWDRSGQQSGVAYYHDHDVKDWLNEIIGEIEKLNKESPAALKVTSAAVTERAPEPVVVDNKVGVPPKGPQGMFPPLSESATPSLGMVRGTVIGLHPQRLPKVRELMAHLRKLAASKGIARLTDDDKTVAAAMCSYLITDHGHSDATAEQTTLESAIEILRLPESSTGRETSTKPGVSSSGLLKAAEILERELERKRRESPSSLLAFQQLPTGQAIQEVMRLVKVCVLEFPDLGDVSGAVFFQSFCLWVVEKNPRAQMPPTGNASRRVDEMIFCLKLLAGVFDELGAGNASPAAAPPERLGAEADTGKQTLKSVVSCNVPEPPATETPKKNVVPLSPKLKVPSADAATAYRVRFATGKNQVEIAELLTEQFRRPVSQGQVSRWLTEVTTWIEAGNVLPNMPTLTAKPVSVDSSVVDMGKREDHLTQRQREPSNEDDENARD